MTDNIRGILLMLAAMAAFVANDLCMKALSGHMPLFETIFLRGIPTTLGLAALTLRQGGSGVALVGRRDWNLIALRALGEVFATFAFLLALGHLPFASLSAIMQSLPLAVTLAAAVFLGERFGIRRLAAILIGFTGVLMIVRPGTDAFNAWSLMGLVSVAFVVLRDLTTRGLGRAVPSSFVALTASLSVGLSAGALMLFGDIMKPTGFQLLLILAASVFLIVGYLTVIMAMRVGDMGVVAPFRYAALIFAVLLSLTIFREVPDAMTLIGSAVIVATGIYTFRRERIIGRNVAPAFTSPRP
jgi:drug/metabolite transporter (DMT)-like permease